MDAMLAMLVAIAALALGAGHCLVSTISFVSRHRRTMPDEQSLKDSTSLEHIILEVELLRNEVNTLRKMCDTRGHENDNRKTQGPQPSVNLGDADYDVLQGFSPDTEPVKRRGGPPPSRNRECFAEDDDFSDDIMQSPESPEVGSRSEEEGTQRGDNSAGRTTFKPAPAVNDHQPEFVMPDCAIHAPTYDTMPVKELRQLMKARELPMRGVKDKRELVDMLREDDRKTPSIRARDRAARKREARENSGSDMPLHERRPRGKSRRRSSDGCLYTPRAPENRAKPSPSPSSMPDPFVAPKNGHESTYRIEGESEDELDSPVSSGHAQEPTLPPSSVNWN